MDGYCDASEFDLDYYGILIKKAWEEAAFAFRFIEDGLGQGAGAGDGRNV